MVTEFDPDEVVRQVTESLRKKFPEADSQGVESIVREEVTTLEKQPVTDYVSVLAERAAKKRLKG